MSLLMSLLITVFDWSTRFLLEPFDCTNELFNAVLGTDFLNSVNSIMTAIGVGLSVVLLVFGLYRVLLGKINDDTPNVFALLARFAIAVFMNFWSVDILYKYVLPVGQSVFDQILAINTTASVKDDFVEQLQILSSGTGATALEKGITQVALGSVFNVNSCLMVFFVIVLIAIVINILKLVIENAERYFVVNVLIITGPAAGATIVSEKSEQIFRSWLQMLLSNVVTIILNLLGFKIIILGFSNCISSLSSSNLLVALVAIVAMIALSKFVQKFDQLVSQIMYKINPIQNRSLLMAGFAGLGTLTKGVDSIKGMFTEKPNSNKKVNEYEHINNKNNASQGNSMYSGKANAMNNAARAAGTAGAAGLGAAAGAAAAAGMRPKPNLSSLREINDTLHADGFTGHMTPDNHIYLDDLNNGREFNLDELNDTLGKHSRQISGLGVDENGDKYLTVGQMAHTDALNEDTVSRFVNDDNSVPSYVDMTEDNVSAWQTANPSYHITSMEQAIGEGGTNRYYVSTQDVVSPTPVSNNFSAPNTVNEPPINSAPSGAADNSPSAE